MRATNWVGDAVMSIPALRALRESFPHAHIAVLARASVADLYARESFCEELLVLGGPRGWRGVADLVATAQQLRSMSFDCSVLLQNAFEAAALVRLAGIPVRIGYDRDARGWLLTHRIPVPAGAERSRHQRFYYLELLQRAGLISMYPEGAGIELRGAAAAALEGLRRFSELGLTEPVIGVSPGAAYGGAKRWLPERFAESASQIANEIGGSIAVFGASAEGALCEAVCETLRGMGHKPLNLAGSTSLGEFISLAAACVVYLTNDSGPMHIASALGVPTVVVFGPTDEAATGPTGPLSRILREPVECSPCLLRECPIDHRCMTRVTTERVASTALSLIEINRIDSKGGGRKR